MSDDAVKKVRKSEAPLLSLTITGDGEAFPVDLQMATSDRGATWTIGIGPSQILLTEAQVIELFEFWRDNYHYVDQMSATPFRRL